jgi:acetoin utilization deacetylase AcuC-like enzyme
MTSGFVAPPRCLEHGPFPGHPERPSRLVAIEERLAACGLGASVERLEPRAARAEKLADVHALAYLTALAATRGRPGCHLDADTPVSPASFDAALSAAGGVL